MKDYYEKGFHEGRTFGIIASVVVAFAIALMITLWKYWL